MNVGFLIRNERKKKNMTLRELEESSGVSYSQIGKIERGENKPTEETIKKLAKALELDSKQLLEAKSLKKEENHLIRFKILSRDNFTCQLCGKKAPNVQLEVSQIAPTELCGEITPNNLITLCSSCHKGRLDLIEKEGLENDVLCIKFKDEETPKI